MVTMALEVPLRELEETSRVSWKRRIVRQSAANSEECLELGKLMRLGIEWAEQCEKTAAALEELIDDPKSTTPVTPLVGVLLPLITVCFQWLSITHSEVIKQRAYVCDLELFEKFSLWIERVLELKTYLDQFPIADKQNVIDSKIAALKGEYQPAGRRTLEFNSCCE